MIQDVRRLLTPQQIQELAAVNDDVVNMKIDRLLLRLAGIGRRG
jgi:hypothetical protein